MVYIAAALLVVLWTVVVSAAPAPNVTITAWQYCEGCKLTVDIYAQVAAKKLKLLDKLPKGEEKVLDAAKVVENLCDNELFNSYGEFGKYSCIKVLEEEHRIKFLEEFAGSTTITSLLNKKGIFEKKQKICADVTKACRSETFDDTNIVGKKRSKCAACTIIANDIATAKRTRNPAVSLRSILEDEENSFCNKLGFAHKPYGWLESLCDEMMEEKLDSILEVVDFHAQVASTGFAPSQTMPQMLCEEFYGCDADLEQSKKPKKVSTQKQRDKASKAKGKAKSGKPKKILEDAEL